MQPTFLPWLGYFDLIDQADVFVFLDHVQFEKQSWQQRNQIRTPNGLEWITIPTLIKGRFGQSIKDAEINRTISNRKIIKQIHQNYSRAVFFNPFFDECKNLFENAYESGNLCNLNIMIIEWLSARFSISVDFIRSSDLDARGNRTELLANILGELNVKNYISPAGSAVYLDKERHLFLENSISVCYQNYEHPEYQQVYQPFMPYASCIDLLFNKGPESLEIIRSGRREPFNLKHNRYIEND